MLRLFPGPVSARRDDKAQGRKRTGGALSHAEGSVTPTATNFRRRHEGREVLFCTARLRTQRQGIGSLSEHRLKTHLIADAEADLAVPVL